jgi:SnoaL-like protein
MPGTPTNEEIARRYARAASDGDDDALAALRAADWQVRWPQSGEVVHGSDAFRAISDNYPGGRPTSHVERIVGVEDRWVVTASNTVLQLAGDGDFWWGEWQMTYPDGRTWNCIDLLELRNGKVWRETVYWAAPFEAPAWRRQWVELENARERVAGP